MPNILICSLGTSWAVIPEVYGFLAPERLPLYRNHPQRLHIEQRRVQYQLQAPDEIWIVTTQGRQTQQSLECLFEWHQGLVDSPVLRIFQAAQTQQLASQQECDDMRELILRTCLAAQERLHGGQLTLSLAGGRKTMSADIQWAGSLFGCQAMLHVIAEEPMSVELKSAPPSFFTCPMLAPLCAEILPLVTGATTRSEILDVHLDQCPPIKGCDYPIPIPLLSEVTLWQANAPRLVDEIRRREQAGSRLLGNYLLEISRHDRHENWRSLYRLPPRLIEQLRQTKLTDQHRAWLVALPKADLHRHLGGCLDLPAQQEVGRAIWDSLTLLERQTARQVIQPLAEQGEWPWDWPLHIKQLGTRSHNAAALLVHTSSDVLEFNLFGVTEPRLALKNQHPQGFEAYERPGELSGSTLLSHPAALETYAKQVVVQAQREGLHYVELRGSPQKYGNGLVFLTQFYDALLNACSNQAVKIEFRFILIADRRHSITALQDTLALAVQAKELLPEFIVGLDLAGDESVANPAKIAGCFLPAFEHCLPLTIHAGEGEAAEAIWEAAYNLHADRIGHGLSIGDHPNLAERFRNRDICLELCPTSNREVVGFFDPNFTATAPYPHYPLLKLWQNGLPLTICTDNPGISRTTLADEYLTAVRMIDYQLSLWDGLAIIKQGFVHAFLPSEAKEQMLKRMDAEIYQLLVDD